MTTNNQTNSLIKYTIVITDFVILNLLIMAFVEWNAILEAWTQEKKHVLWLACNLAMLMAQVPFYNIVHQRFVTVSDVLKRVILLAVTQVVLSYVLLKVLNVSTPAGKLLMQFGPPLLALLLLSRFLERWIIKRYRQMGVNTRAATFIGNDPELEQVYNILMDQTMGYRINGYYANAEIGEWTYSESDKSRTKSEGSATAEAYKQSSLTRSHEPIKRLGTLDEFLEKIESDPESLELGDELYVSLSRRDKEIVRRISRFCDKQVIRFYYVPVSVESLGINLKREMLDDIEIFSTYEIPLKNPVNQFIKRAFDIVASLVFLIPTALLFPFIYVIIKTQSPGPIFFKQKRTGLDGKEFEMLKFRSMHVNKDADKLQATKDDPRKFPFGNFMRASNIDELPQFLNVLKGDMSFVGPRPHMLLHTEQYSKLIDKYMVRHFVKPGLTGWAQVTGFRGETKELWQMEGRVKRDIWYIENWSIWLDIRIIWLTAKTVFIHDKNAY